MPEPHLRAGIMRELKPILLAATIAAITVTGMRAAKRGLTKARRPCPRLRRPRLLFRRIYLMHFSHTDVGFTDMPGVCRELHRRYIDIALDGVLATLPKPAGEKFCWTCESLIAVDDWWQAASPARRDDFLKALCSGQLDVGALPCNQTPFLDAAEWQTMLHWTTEDLWQKFQPQVALQDDVNGFPRAGAMALLDRGITRLCMGINGTNGGPPFFRPSAFWWKMPDGRRLFVWLNLAYPDGYGFFENGPWRRGPVPFASDTRYRPPRAGDFFRTDEASLRASHAQCLRRLAASARRQATGTRCWRFPSPINGASTTIRRC